MVSWFIKAARVGGMGMILGATSVATQAAEHEAFFVLIPKPGNTSVSSQSSNGYTLSLATLGSVEAAQRLAKELAAKGVTAIELSSGFGEGGLSAVRDTVGDKVRVGLVRYDWK